MTGDDDTGFGLRRALTHGRHKTSYTQIHTEGVKPLGDTKGLSVATTEVHGLAGKRAPNQRRRGSRLVVSVSGDRCVCRRENADTNALKQPTWRGLGR